MSEGDAMSTDMRLCADTPEQYELIEKLAEIEHQRWAAWQHWMHEYCCSRHPDGSLTIPSDLVERWERQINTVYADLSEQEKESDREQVARYWPLVAPFLCPAPECHASNEASVRRHRLARR